MALHYVLDADWDREKWTAACRCIEAGRIIPYPVRGYSQVHHQTSEPLRPIPPPGADHLARILAYIYGNGA